MDWILGVGIGSNKVMNVTGAGRNEIGTACACRELYGDTMVAYRRTWMIAHHLAGPVLGAGLCVGLVVAIAAPAQAAGRAALGRRAAFVGVDAGGHGVYGNGSCADAVADTFLVTGELPKQEAFRAGPTAPTARDLAASGTVAPPMSPGWLL